MSAFWEIVNLLIAIIVAIFLKTYFILSLFIWVYIFFLQTSIAKVREDLNKIKHHQDQLKAIESRDRNLQEHNFTRVNQFSVLIIVVMIVVGAVQVIMVRSLFEEHSRLHKIFKMLSWWSYYISLFLIYHQIKAVFLVLSWRF